jgi:hypothetical protein
VNPEPAVMLVRTGSRLVSSTPTCQSMSVVVVVSDTVLDDVAPADVSRTQLELVNSSAFTETEVCVDEPVKGIEMCCVPVAGVVYHPVTS